MPVCLLKDRCVIQITGSDSYSFLQGLISNDMQNLSVERALYAALLTPQGKYLFDFFLATDGSTIFLDAAIGQQEALIRRLMMYRLRSKVEITLAEGISVIAATRSEPLESDPLLSFDDPRLKEMGRRYLVEQHLLGDNTGSMEDYHRHRLLLGVSDGPQDFLEGKSTLLENHFEELHGVDFNKGCYVGQELTARTKYRGLVKKQLLPVTISGPSVDPGTPIKKAGKVAGEMRSSQADLGLALLRKDMIGDGMGLDAQGSTVTLRQVDWLQATHK